MHSAMSLLTFLVAMLMVNAVNAGAIHVRQEAASPAKSRFQVKSLLKFPANYDSRPPTRPSHAGNRETSTSGFTPMSYGIIEGPMATMYR